eukprot:scaffold19308_cov75-Skeletonema_marinoi.AAC.1
MSRGAYKIEPRGILDVASSLIGDDGALKFQADIPKSSKAHMCMSLNPGVENSIVWDAYDTSREETFLRSFYFFFDDGADMFATFFGGKDVVIVKEFLKGDAGRFMPAKPTLPPHSIVKNEDDMDVNSDDEEHRPAPLNEEEEAEAYGEVVDESQFTLSAIVLGDPRVEFQKLQVQVLGRVSLFAWAYSLELEYNDANIEAALEVIKAMYSNIYDRHTVATRVQEVQVFVTRQLAYSRLAKDHRLMTTPDGNGQLPLHTALQSNATLGSIKLLVKGNPPAVQSPDNNGSLPLHIAYTVTLDAVDHSNNTALNYACRGAKHETITLLMDKYDAVSVSKRNAQKKLPIDLLWESNEVLDRESVEYMESVFRLLKASLRLR